MGKLNQLSGLDWKFPIGKYFRCSSKNSILGKKCGFADTHNIGICHLSGFHGVIYIVVTLLGK